MFDGVAPWNVVSPPPAAATASSSASDKAVNVLQRMCKLQKRVQVWAENTSGT